MDDFWDGMLTRVAYQIAINEHSDINREFYSIDQAKEYLKAKSPTEYFDNVVIADLIREEKLELVASFAKEVSLAKIEGNPYFMDDYKLQKCITISCRNPLVAFKLIPLNPSGLEMIARVIVNQIIGNHLLSVSTRHDIFLFRQNEYWKVVDIDMCQLSGDVLYYPRCFLNDVTWGISAKSLERYCDTKNNISKSENSKKANQTQHGDKYALYEQIKPLWREKRHLIDSGELSRKKFAMKVLDSPLNHGLNGSKIMCGENSWRTITKLIKEWESEEN